MSLTLYYHPLSSYCWKALIAFYENDTPLTPQMVNLGDPDARAALVQLWPVGKFPVLYDAARDRVIPESSVIIAYLDEYYPGATRFIPAAGDLGWQTRLQDRFYDLHVHQHVQAIVGDRLRAAADRDPCGVEEARRRLRTAYAMIERDMATKTWAMGDHFSLADCAASPALFYANKVMPFGDAHSNITAYLDRLMARPAFARVIREAEPYFHMFPQEEMA